ncbi:MAG: peptidylprolyl isomerase [Actinomycetota bacterium]
MGTEKRDRQRANKEAGNRVAAAQADTAARRMRATLGAIAAVVIAVVAITLITRGDDDESTTTTASDDAAPATTAAPDTATDDDNSGAATDAETGCPAEDGSSPRTLSFDSPPPMCIDPTQTHVAVFDTSEGEVRVTLNTTDTPMTTNNFVTLARWGYYDGTTIFRTDPSIDIIQGGAPNTEAANDPGPGYQIQDEPQFDDSSGQLLGPYRYVPGQLVMARTGQPNSASGQFFFTTGPNAALLDGQGTYVVFGETDDSGLGVLQQIIGMHVPGGRLGGAPSETVTINSVTIEVS